MKRLVRTRSVRVLSRASNRSALYDDLVFAVGLPLSVDFLVSGS